MDGGGVLIPVQRNNLCLAGQLGRSGDGLSSSKEVLDERAGDDVVETGKQTIVDGATERDEVAELWLNVTSVSCSSSGNARHRLEIRHPRCSRVY